MYILLLFIGLHGTVLNSNKVLHSGSYLSHRTSRSETSSVTALGNKAYEATALGNKAYEALYTFSHFNPIQTQVIF